VDWLLCSELLEMDLKPSDETIQCFKELFVKYTIRFAHNVRHIVLIEDTVDSLKARCSTVYIN